MATVTRYVCTYVNQDGMRTLMTAALGRYTYETAEDAQQHLDAILCDNSASTLAYLYGHNFKPEVRSSIILRSRAWVSSISPASSVSDGAAGTRPLGTPYNAGHDVSEGTVPPGIVALSEGVAHTPSRLPETRRADWSGYFLPPGRRVRADHVGGALLAARCPYIRHRQPLCAARRAQRRTNLSIAAMAFNEFRTSANRATHLAGPLSHPF
jgi:hypothetical protein